MPTTYTPLATTTLSSAQPTVTFSTISGSYTDLVLIVNAQSTQATTYDNLIIQFNSDTGNNYSRQRLNAFSSGATADRSSNASSIGVGVITGTSFASSIFSQSTTQIQNYSNTTMFKSVLYRSGSQDAYVQAGAGTWRSTSAITSISIKTASGSNLAAGSTFSLYGVASAAVVSGAKATGGDVVATDGTYWYHAFLASGTFTPTQALSCDVMTIAGGGGGFGGGGGAGGFRVLTSQSLSTNNYTVTVGAGGSGGGSSGSNTTISGTGLTTISATGGGGGGYQGNGIAGGSGGGGHNSNNTARSGGSGNAGSYSPSEGNAGGNAAAMSINVGGGGGGAGAVGGNSTASVPAAGGNGTSAYSSWGAATGTGQNISGTYWYAGGGSGADQNGNSAAGGNGGGGQGDRNPNTGIRNNGLANMGAGGGGGYYAIYGNGGSGLVIVRYSV